jgi:translation initiation factor IF-3
MIRASEVRLVAEDGEQLGIQGIKEALEVAAEAGLDLVEVAPTAKPPVCRLMDYGKYKYLMSKKATEAKKKQTVIHVKEIKLRSKTGEHDLQFKLRNIIKFLKAGDKVKVTMVFRGREITHTELGLERLKRIKEDVEEYGTVEQQPKLEGRSMTMLVAPLAQK